MTEIFNRFKNPEIWIINKINEKFRFDFKKHDMIMKKHEVIPITEKENIDKDAGVCDECGEYSNELMLIDGQWVCPDCNEYRI